MDPNTNQPGAGQLGQLGQPGQQPAQPQDEWPPHQAPVPDWQQGLGTSGVATPQPGQSVTPGATPPAGGTGTPVYPGPAPGGVAPMPQMGGAPPKNRGSKIPIILLVVLLIVLGGAVAWYFLIYQKGNSDADKAAKSSSSSAKEAVSLSTLQDLTFSEPSDLSAFKADSSTNAAYHVYLTQSSTDDKLCSLEYGVVTPTDLPGGTIDDIVDPQIKSLKDAGATVTGPSAGDALILKDAKDSAKTYSMPTLNYEFSKDTRHATVHYSLAILKGGNRAVVSRQCANKNGDIDKAELAKIEAAAKKITVNSK